MNHEENFEGDKKQEGKAEYTKKLEDYSRNSERTEGGIDDRKIAFKPRKVEKERARNVVVCLELRERVIQAAHLV